MPYFTPSGPVGPGTTSTPFIQTHALANDTGQVAPPGLGNSPPSINNYFSTPGNGSGVTSTDSNGGSGLNYLLIIGIVVVAAIVLFMVK